MQNFAPGTLSVPQRGQTVAAPLTFRGGKFTLRFLVLATYNIKGGVGQDLGRGQPRLPRCARRRQRRCCGTSTRRAEAPTCCASSRKIKGGGRKLVRGKSDPRRGSRAQTTTGSTCSRPTSPTATWTSHLDATKRPTRRLGRVLSPLAPDYDFVFLDCPPSISLVSESVFEAADALLIPLLPATLSARTLDYIDQVAGATGQAACRSSRWSTRASACTAT